VETVAFLLENMAKNFLGKPADVWRVEASNQRSDDGSTSLHAASYLGHHAIAALLLAHGADVNAEDCDGVTALDEAGSAEVVQLLVKNGAKVSRSDIIGRTALHRAVCWQPFQEWGPPQAGSQWHPEGDRRLEAIGALIEAGAAVNALSRNGETPLDLAAESLDGAAKWVKEEEERAKSPEIKDAEQLKAMAEDKEHRARCMKHLARVVDLLRKHGGRSAKDLK
jgi:hypothetical protein